MILSANLKKLICWVRPGELEVLAREDCLVKALIMLDFPTFERPANAISGSPTSGIPSKVAAPVTKWHGFANKALPSSSVLELTVFSFPFVVTKPSLFLPIGHFLFLHLKYCD